MYTTYCYTYTMSMNWKDDLQSVLMKCELDEKDLLVKKLEDFEDLQVLSKTQEKKICELQRVQVLLESHLESALEAPDAALIEKSEEEIRLEEMHVDRKSAITKLIEEYIEGSRDEISDLTQDLTSFIEEEVKSAIRAERVCVRHASEIAVLKERHERELEEIAG